MNEKRCDHCKHCRDFRDGGHLQCFRMQLSHPCQYMRDARSPCGPDGKLFEPIDLNKELLG